ncbi:MAG: class I SAM-dependent methyltransferase [Candidatus Nitronauta litoralis]|uniref:Class I SAM-dependent methyltransferase n=1 Tax=Candidatus Nitronauta litoralis TaxID=2705533 RepID=A0A7T0FZ47_9BACT|nr:MAG: class I SAM-dependent methyltransferase [Candidatus Nitronauta litoralis]
MKHEQAEIVIESPASNNINRIQVNPFRDDLFIPVRTCETRYPVELIKKILEVKGPAYLCDEIVREESPGYVQRSLHYDLLSYVDLKQFSGKRILDFGCGSGASTMILGRMFPDTKIVGIELEESLLSIARSRAHHYEMDSHIELLKSPNGNSLPPNIGRFDYIILSAVYEHLLPSERKKLLPVLWDRLKEGGILFLNQTPYRWFPVELHTTSGLPFINYLPDSLAHVYAQRFSKRNLQGVDWSTLLRKGIRGASVGEIFKILKENNASPVLLQPDKEGSRDRVDLWYVKYRNSKMAIVKVCYYLFKIIKMVTGLVLSHNLSLAIQKKG